MPTQLTGSLDLTALPLDATEAQRNEKVNTILRLARPLANITGSNGVKVHLADANLVIEVDPDGADDAGGATTNESGDVNTPDGGGTTGGGTPDPSDPGEPFTPGDANTPDAAVAYESRKRSGVASLVGHSEYTSASTPPKKYRVKAFTGVAEGRLYSDAGCTNLVFTNTDTHSGASTYDVVTGSVTNTGQFVRTGTESSTTSITEINPFTAGGDTAVLTRLTKGITNPLTAVAFEGNYFKRPSVPTALATLSIEDTDADAVTRLLATSPTFTDWSAAASFPAAAADYDARTTGFTFDYEQTQLRANYTGMPASWPFKVRVRIARVNIATGAISTTQTLNFNPTADGSGAATWTVDVVPAAPGFTYRVQSVAHFL
jgi:hypothetical protein